MNVVGWLVIVYGVGIWVVGYFLMDVDLFIKNLIFNCKVYFWVGFIMLFLLVIVLILVVISLIIEIILLYFCIFLLFFVVVVVYFFFVMVKVVKF